MPEQTHKALLSDRRYAQLGRVSTALIGLCGVAFTLAFHNPVGAVILGVVAIFDVMRTNTSAAAVPETAPAKNLLQKLSGPVKRHPTMVATSVIFFTSGFTTPHLILKIANFFTFQQYFGVIADREEKLGVRTYDDKPKNGLGVALRVAKETLLAPTFGGYIAGALISAYVGNYPIMIVYAALAVITTYGRVKRVFDANTASAETAAQSGGIMQKLLQLTDRFFKNKGLYYAVQAAFNASDALVGQWNGKELGIVLGFAFASAANFIDAVRFRHAVVSPALQET